MATSSPPTTGTTAGTRTLLLCATAGAVIWTVVSLAQAATRDGFDLTRHPLSVLATGDLGWLQITNFVVGGVLTVLGAAGLRRALPEARVIYRLVAVDGVARIVAGLLVMDPAPGFPPGTPEQVALTMSPSAVGHLLAGTVSFVALTVVCVLFGRRFSRAGQQGPAIASRAAATAVVLGNAWGIAGAPAGPVAVAVGVITGMLWLGAVTAALARR
ncbi:DUF998 domain-containing protein [Pseudonocardia sp. NPDC049635]|uniref:DUF998 domain-containing protein n=1 Tax=Pseudonocardia sp. NPDC049635 TaxID=3155506 RepID=UPI0033CC73FA